MVKGKHLKRESKSFVHTFKTNFSNFFNVSFKIFLAIALVVSFFPSTKNSNSAYADEESNVTITSDTSKVLYAPATDGASKYQWQIKVDGTQAFESTGAEIDDVTNDGFIDINDATTSALTVTYSMIQNVLIDDVATIKCIVKDADSNELNTKLYYVTYDHSADDQLLTNDSLQDEIAQNAIASIAQNAYTVSSTSWVNDDSYAEDSDNAAASDNNAADSDNAVASDNNSTTDNNEESNNQLDSDNTATNDESDSNLDSTNEDYISVTVRFKAGDWYAPITGKQSYKKNSSFSWIMNVGSSLGNPKSCEILTEGVSNKMTATVSSNKTDVYIQSTSGVDKDVIVDVDFELSIGTYQMDVYYQKEDQTYSDTPDDHKDNLQAGIGEAAPTQDAIDACLTDHAGYSLAFKSPGYVTIQANETKVTVKFARTYFVTFFSVDATNGEVSEQKAVLGMYGAKINASFGTSQKPIDPTRPAYEFTGWEQLDSSGQATGIIKKEAADWADVQIPNENVTYVARWMVDSEHSGTNKLTITLAYMCENANDQGYEYIMERYDSVEADSSLGNNYVLPANTSATDPMDDRRYPQVRQSSSDPITVTSTIEDIPFISGDAYKFNELYEYAGYDTNVVVKPEGTIVNVYLNRKTFTYQFSWKYKVGSGRKKKTYTKTYDLTAKWDQDIFKAYIPAKNSGDTDKLPGVQNIGYAAYNELETPTTTDTLGDGTYMQYTADGASETYINYISVMEKPPTSNITKTRLHTYSKDSVASGKQKIRYYTQNPDCQFKYCDDDAKSNDTFTSTLQSSYSGNFKLLVEIPVISTYTTSIEEYITLLGFTTPTPYDSTAKTGDGPALGTKFTTGLSYYYKRNSSAAYLYNIHGCETENHYDNCIDLYPQHKYPTETTSPYSANGVHYGSKLGDFKMTQAEKSEVSKGNFSETGVSGMPTDGTLFKNWTPSPPESVDQNLIFGGWYLDIGFTLPIDLDTYTMPNHELNIYAKWISPSQKYNYVKTDPITKKETTEVFLTQDQLSTETEKYGETVSTFQPQEEWMTSSNYRFIGWYYYATKEDKKNGVKTWYEPSQMGLPAVDYNEIETNDGNSEENILYLHQAWEESGYADYSVVFRAYDENDQYVADIADPYYGRAALKEEVECSAKTDPQYFYEAYKGLVGLNDSTTKKITLTTGTNEIEFKYKFTSYRTFTIKWVDENGDNIYKPNGDEITPYTKAKHYSNFGTGYAYGGNDTEYSEDDFVGYTLVTDSASISTVYDTKTIFLDEVASKNVITFKFNCKGNATYNFNVITLDKSGQESSSLSGGVTIPATQTAICVAKDKTVVSDASYIPGFTFIGWYKSDKTTPVDTSRVEDTKFYPPKDSDGLYHVGTTTYYAKFKEKDSVTLNYVPVFKNSDGEYKENDTTGGTLTSTSETLSPAAASATGSIANTKKETDGKTYYKVTWCKKDASGNYNPVASETGTTPSAGQLLPPKEDVKTIGTTTYKAYTDGTFYAVFEEDESKAVDITYKISNVKISTATITGDNLKTVGIIRQKGVTTGETTQLSQKVMPISGKVIGAGGDLGAKAYNGVGNYTKPDEGAVWYSSTPTGGSQDPVCTTAEFVPSKASGSPVYTTTTYYATFVLNTVDLEWTTDGWSSVSTNPVAAVPLGSTVKLYSSDSKKVEITYKNDALGVSEGTYSYIVTNEPKDGYVHSKWTTKADGGTETEITTGSSITINTKNTLKAYNDNKYKNIQIHFLTDGNGKVNNNDTYDITTGYNSPTSYSVNENNSIVLTYTDKDTSKSKTETVTQTANNIALEFYVWMYSETGEEGTYNNLPEDNKVILTNNFYLKAFFISAGNLTVHALTDTHGKINNEDTLDITKVPSGTTSYESLSVSEYENNLNFTVGSVTRSVVAKANAGYKFDKWQYSTDGSAYQDLPSAAEDRKLLQDTYFKACFKTYEITITFATSGSGSVDTTNIKMESATNSTSIDESGNLTFTYYDFGGTEEKTVTKFPVAAANNKYSKWETNGGISPAGGTCTVDTQFTVVFIAADKAQISYAVAEDSKDGTNKYSYGWIQSAERASSSSSYVWTDKLDKASTTGTTETSDAGQTMGKAIARDGYKFVGWTKNSGTETVEPNAEITPTKVDGKYVTTTYYAHFKKDEVSIQCTSSDHSQGAAVYKGTSSTDTTPVKAEALYKTSVVSHGSVSENGQVTDRLYVKYIVDGKEIQTNTVDATPVANAGYTFDKWQYSTDGLSYADLPDNLKLESETTYFKASFKTYTLQVNFEVQNTGTDAQPVYNGTVKMGSGTSVTSQSVDVDTLKTYTFSTITDTSSKGKAVYSGESETKDIVATGNDNYCFDKWIIKGGQEELTGEYTIKKVVTFVACFTTYAANMTFSSGDTSKGKIYDGTSTVATETLDKSVKTLENYSFNITADTSKAESSYSKLSCVDANGSSFDVYAKPETGYTFNKWVVKHKNDTEEEVTKDTSKAFNDGDKLIAYFDNIKTAKFVWSTGTSSSGGKISEGGGSAKESISLENLTTFNTSISIDSDGNFSLKKGDETLKTITPVANAGYKFDKWTYSAPITGDVTTEDKVTYGYTMVIANFKTVDLHVNFISAYKDPTKQEYTVLENNNTGGTVDISSINTISANTYSVNDSDQFVTNNKAGEETKISVTPKSGFDFYGWYIKGDNPPTSDPTKISNGIFGVNDSNITFVALFKEIDGYADLQYSVDPSDGSGGKIYTNQGDYKTSIEELILPVSGTPSTVTAVPMAGYHFVNWTDESGNEVTKEATYTVQKIGSEESGFSYDNGQYVAHFAQDSNIDIKYSIVSKSTELNAENCGILKDNKTEPTAHGTGWTQNIAPATGTLYGATANAYNGVYFKGWYLDAQGADPVPDKWLSEDKLTVQPQKIAGTIGSAYKAATYYAIFFESNEPDPSPAPEPTPTDPVKSSITYNAAFNGQISDTAGKVQIQGGAAAATCSQDVLPITEDAKTCTATAQNGYVFKGWNTKVDGTGDYISLAKDFVPEKVKCTAPQKDYYPKQSTYYAIFEEAEDVTLTYTVEGYGYVKSSDKADTTKTSTVSETLKPVTGSAKGSIPIAKNGAAILDGYYEALQQNIKCWTYIDGNGNEKAVPEEWIDSNYKLIPQKIDGAYQNTTFTAHFVENSDVTIKYVADPVVIDGVEYDVGKLYWTGEKPVEEEEYFKQLEQTLAPISGVAKHVSVKTLLPGVSIDKWTMDDSTEPLSGTDLFYATKEVDNNGDGCYTSHTYHAHFSVSVQSNYTLEYYVESVESANQRIAENPTNPQSLPVNGYDAEPRYSETYTADTFSTVNLRDKIKDIAGFTSYSFDPANATFQVQADGSSVGKIYYKRDVTSVVISADPDEEISYIDINLPDAFLAPKGAETVEINFPDNKLVYPDDEPVAIPETAGAEFHASVKFHEKFYKANYQVNNPHCHVTSESEQVKIIHGQVSGTSVQVADGWEFVNWTDQNGNVVSTDINFSPSKPVVEVENDETADDVTITNSPAFTLAAANFADNDNALRSDSPVLSSTSSDYTTQNSSDPEEPKYNKFPGSKYYQTDTYTANFKESVQSDGTSASTGDSNNTALLMLASLLSAAAFIALCLGGARLRHRYLRK